MKTLKFSDYIKIKRPEYIYIKITSHKSVRNYNSTNIAKMIALTFKSLNKRMYKLDKQFIIETNFKISYLIDIKNNNAEFYFIIPSVYKNQLLEKINEIWNKATVEVVDKIDEPLQDFVYEVRTNKEDPLSISYDKKSNEPLNNILASMDVMNEEDRVSVIFNFMPRSQQGWNTQYEDTMTKIKQKEPIEKPSMSAGYIVKKGLFGILGLVDVVFNVITDFAGVEKEGTKESLYSAILGVMEQQQGLSVNTKKKREALIIPTEIAICSNKEELCRSTGQAFRVLDEDNELISLPVKKANIGLENYSLGVKESTFSVDEVSNFIKIPGRLLLTQHKIAHTNVEETQIPDLLKEGYFYLGENKYKNTYTKAYLQNEYNTGNYPLVMIGSQGGGKSEFIKNVAINCMNNGEGVILIDFIKSCNLSETIAKHVPEDRLVKIDLASEKTLQGLGYNEIKITEDMDSFTKVELASNQAQQIMNLVDSIVVGDPLSDNMRMYLSAAGKVVFASGESGIKEVVKCLQNHKTRQMYIEKVEGMKEYLEEEIEVLLELNEYSKITKDNPVSEVVGTISSKINHIMSRISMLREDFKLKEMYKRNCDNNIDLVECMEKGKIVLIQMKEANFQGKMIKNILVTYWVSKIWLATQIRGGMSEKPLRCNFIVDEIFQAPTCLKMMEYILPQSRKFGLHTILSTQYINQLDYIFECLEGSGSSFMLFRGANEDDFNHFKSKFDSYEYEDLKDIALFHTLNLIYYQKGYAQFISKLPPVIK